MNTVPFKTDINAHVFRALQHSLQIISGTDHYCCLMFDEMSIKESIHFSEKLDYIEGFKDCGNQGRMHNIANDALVFMTCGIHKKWMQAVTYGFIRGSTKAEVTVQYLNEVLDACQNARMKVIATNCDMGAINIALKPLGANQKETILQIS